MPGRVLEAGSAMVTRIAPTLVVWGGYRQVCVYYS